MYGALGKGEVASSAVSPRPLADHGGGLQPLLEDSAEGGSPEEDSMGWTSLGWPSSTCLHWSAWWWLHARVAKVLVPGVFLDECVLLHQPC